jgi:hypothetical protein
MAETLTKTVISNGKEYTYHYTKDLSVPRKRCSTYTRDEVIEILHDYIRNGYKISRLHISRETAEKLFALHFGWMTSREIKFRAREYSGLRDIIFSKLPKIMGRWASQDKTPLQKMLLERFKEQF